jgi:hypothetical protein
VSGTDSVSLYKLLNGLIRFSSFTWIVVNALGVTANTARTAISALKLCRLFKLHSAPEISNSHYRG